MHRFSIIIVLTVALFGCKNPSSNSETHKSTSADTSKIGRDNYAVIWEWETEDIDLINSNSATITQELVDLWENDDIENVYYDPIPVRDPLGYFPSISFFLKSKSLNEAKLLLNRLTIVKKEIASYKIFPVGMLWLDLVQDFNYERGKQKSYVSIWTSNAQSQRIEDLKKAQNDSVLSLWNRGQIENIYFNLDGVSDHNNTTDFVFFINADSHFEADSICKSLPFFKKEIATYELHQAGVLWMGINNK